MKKSNEIKVVAKEFIKEKLKGMLLFIFFCFIFITILYLQDIPIKKSLYAMELCSFFGVIYLSCEFYKSYKKHFQLVSLKEQITINIDNLPEVSTLTEKDYQEILQLLHEYMKSMQSKQLADEKALQDYYTLWVHQIKTPITAMSLILQSQEDTKAAQMKQELFKIEQYAEMVMHYLKMGNMNSDLVIGEYSLDRIVKQTIKKYASVFIYRKISLQLDELNTYVLTDEKWLSFVIGQLLSNSLKYTNKGYIKIYMKEDAEKILVIEDDGIGISKQDLPRVFEQGFTGYNGRMDKKASGLGLYLCKKVMNNLSHKINIESEEGKGTKVFLDLCQEKIEIE